MWQLHAQHFIWVAIELRLQLVAVTPGSKGGISTRTYSGVTLKHLRHSLTRVTKIIPLQRLSESIQNNCLNEK
jgi:hypothetical protein